MFSVYDARHKGIEYCQTEGSDHYKENGIEPIDLIMSTGYDEGFFLGNVIKYATRYKRTHNLEDLKKCADYAHLACGAELLRQETTAEETARMQR